MVQPDPYTLSLRLRTPLSTSWLHLSWHPVAARVALGAPPPRGATSEAFTLVEQVRGHKHVCEVLYQQQLNGADVSYASLPCAHTSSQQCLLHDRRQYTGGHTVYLTPNNQTEHACRQGYPTAIMPLPCYSYRLLPSLGVTPHTGGLCPARPGAHRGCPGRPLGASGGAGLCTTPH